MNLADITFLVTWDYGRLASRAFRDIGKVLAVSDAESVLVILGIAAGRVAEQVLHRRDHQISSEVGITPGLDQLSPDVDFVVAGCRAVVTLHIILRQQNHLIRLDILQLSHILVTIGQLNHQNRTFITSNPHNLHHSFQYWFGLFFNVRSIYYNIFFAFFQFYQISL